MTPALNLGFRNRRSGRLIRQSEVAECGLACLAMVAAHHGLDVDLGTLRRRFPQSARGATLQDLMRIADELGFAPRAVKLPLTALSKLHAPAILHWEFNHFVVVQQVEAKRALILNPEGQSRWYGLDEISPKFTGVALELRPSTEFEPGDKRERLRLSQLWQRVTGLKRALGQTLLLTVVLQVFALASPYYMQLALDAAAPALDRDLLTVLALGFGLLVVFGAAVTLLRSFVLMNVGTNLGYSLAVNITRRLLRLPADWFAKRQVGDILSRFQSVAPVQQLLSQSAVTVLVDGVMALFTLALMFLYSTALACVALAAFALYLLVRVITFPMQRDAQEEAIVAVGKEQSVLIETLRGIVTVRLFNRETQRHALWQSRLVDATNAGIGQSRIGYFQATANSLIFGLENILSVWLAVGFVIEGGFSTGMVFAYFAYKGQFQGKASSLVDQAIAFRMIGLHLERLADIALTPVDPSYVRRGDGSAELKGTLELKDVSYRHGPNEPLVLDRINLKVEPGDHVAITGPSGGGKSTLVKIMLGLVEPTDGEVLVDGVPLARFGHANYRNQVGAVLQDDNLFAGSLAENISFFDPDFDRERMIQAARAAAIHDDIAQTPMGYETLVGDMGSALSSGQKQRVLLARALYRRPKLLIVDEGTAFLDARHERAVNEAISALGITRVIIAHRQETLAAAELVYLKAHAPGLKLIRSEPAALAG